MLRIFFVVTLIAAGCYMVRKNQIKTRAEQAAKSAAQTMLADPMLVAAGIQIVRAIGVKKLIPILAVGGLALGLLASRGQSHAGAKRRRSSSRRSWFELVVSREAEGRTARKTSRFAFKTSHTTLSRRVSPEVCWNFRPSKSEGAGNAGCALHPRSHVQCVQEMRTRAYRSAEASDIPCAMALRLITCSPRRTAFLPPSPPRSVASRRT